MKQENYQDVLSQFKVEELKERLEFDMAGGGREGKTEAKAKVTLKDGKVGGEVGLKKEIGFWRR